MSNYPFHNFSNRDITEAARYRILAGLGYRTAGNPHPLATIESAADDLSLAGTAAILGRKVLQATNSRDVGRRTAEIRAGLTTSEFRELLDDLTKGLLERSFELNLDHRRLFQLVDAVDYRPFKLGDLDTDGGFGPVNEQGEYNAVAVGNSGETMQLSRYGKIIDLTDEVIYDDAVAMVQRVVADAAQAAARFEQRTAYAAITDPGTLEDAQAFYDASNTATITAWSVPELSKAFAALRAQTLGGHPLNLAPRAALVSPNNELVLGALLVLAGVQLDVHVTPSAADDELYLLAGPSQFASFGLAFLAGGNRDPRIVRDRPRVSVAGTRYRVQHEFDAKPLARTGVLKATVSAGE